MVKLSFGFGLGSDAVVDVVVILNGSMCKLESERESKSLSVKTMHVIRLELQLRHKILQMPFIHSLLCFLMFAVV